MRVLATALLIALLVLTTGARAQVVPHLNVWVVAPSLSTRMEATTVLAKLFWTSVSIRRADAALVVARSMLDHFCDFRTSLRASLRRMRSTN
jgi:hypothetical protein